MRVWLQIKGSRVRSRSDPILSWRLIMISTVILLLPLIHSRRVVVSYKRKYVHELLFNRLFKACPGKSVVRWTDRPAMTIAVDLGRKANKQTNKQTSFITSEPVLHFRQVVYELPRTRWVNALGSQASDESNLFRFHLVTISTKLFQFWTNWFVMC